VPFLFLRRQAMACLISIQRGQERHVGQWHNFVLQGYFSSTFGCGQAPVQVVLLNVDVQQQQSRRRNEHRRCRTKSFASQQSKAHTTFWNHLVASTLLFSCLCFLQLLVNTSASSPQSSPVPSTGAAANSSNVRNLDDYFYVKERKVVKAQKQKAVKAKMDASRRQTEKHKSFSPASKGGITIDFGNQKARVLPGPVQRLKSFGSHAVGKVRRRTAWPHRAGTNNQLAQSFFKREGEGDSKTTGTMDQASPSLYRTSTRTPSQQQVHLVVTPENLGTFAMISFRVSSATLQVIMGTLRLLAPMVVARKTLLVLGDVGCDYMRGRYFRTTYTRMERVYLRYYEAPAAFRALARCLSQIFIFFLLQKVMGWMVGTNHPPCRSANRGLAFLCGTLWIFSVVGIGHAFAMYIARWGGPLRVQAVQHYNQASSSSQRDSRTRLREGNLLPRQMLHWMRDPQKWLRVVLLDHSHAPESIYHVVDRTSPMNIHKGVEFKPPNPLIFPITWGPLRLLQMFALAKIFMTDPPAIAPSAGVGSSVASALCTGAILPELPPIPNTTGGGAGTMQALLPDTPSAALAIEGLMRQFLVQLALGDEWCRVFLEERRVGLAIGVAGVYFISLVTFVFQAASFLIQNSSSSAASALDRRGNRSEVAALLCLFPSVVATIVTLWMNVVIFWNRMTGKRKREAIHGFEETKKKMLKALTLNPPMY
jgi:hypothetical protein